jgi:hypothetical protein
VSSLELGSVTVQARLGSTWLLYKLDSARLGYCTSSAKLNSARIVYRPIEYMQFVGCMIWNILKNILFIIEFLLLFNLVTRPPLYQRDMPCPSLIYLELIK